MATARELVLYIPGKLDLLNTRKRRTRRIGLAGYVAGLAMVVFDADLLPQSVLLAFVSFFGTAAVVGCCNLHADFLSFLWRDMDRDKANGLFDFETPIR